LTPRVVIFIRNAPGLRRRAIVEAFMSPTSDIFISTGDARELDRVLSDHLHRDETGETALELSAKLFEAQVVAPEALPHGTVRLDSTVTYEELPGRTRRRVTLVPPRNADASAGRISILSPVGRALLGNALGHVVHVVLPTGRQQSVRVVEVSPPHRDRVEESLVADVN
jgi:regulator of nucleoside diphosphate kinase